MASQSPLLTALHKDGYVIIPSLIPQKDLQPLRDAARRTTDLAHSGNWPHVRTLPRQFPPWPPSAPSTPPTPGIWGVQSLLHPSLPDHDIFTQHYFSSAVLSVVKDLLQCTDAELVMELCNLLVRPTAHFHLRWHRDDIPADASPAQETARLAEPAWHAQWNAALYEDESLLVVPGSQARARTDEERGTGEYEPMAGEKIVRLAAGDAVFYDNNILHRGVYWRERERATLHGSVGHVLGGKVRARNVLQHGVGSWVAECEFGCLGAEGGVERERAEGMRRRLMEMGRGGEEVGYSLDG